MSYLTRRILSVIVWLAALWAFGYLDGVVVYDHRPHWNWMSTPIFCTMAALTIGLIAWCVDWEDAP